MSSNAAEFLNALFCCTSNDIHFDLNGERVVAGDAAFVQQHDGELRVHPFVEGLGGGSCFVFGVQTESHIDDYLSCQLPPTLVLFKGDSDASATGTSIFVWAFKEPVDDIHLSLVTDALGMESADEAIPVPGTDGWHLAFCDPTVSFTLAELAERYVGPNGELATEGLSDEGATASEASAPATYGDAVVCSPYVETDYPDEITVTVGPNAEAKQWKPMPMPAGAFIAKLCRHVEGTKDGPAFVLGDMVAGRRLKTSVKALYGVGLDIDTGTASAQIDSALAALHCFAVRYTTHSHNKTKTEFKKDKVVKFAGDREIDDALIHDFLRQDQLWDDKIVATASYGGTDHTERGIVVQVTHAPMPKHRVVVLFKEPFEVGKEGKTQKEAMDKWAKVPEALATMLGVPFDTSCTDPSRLFYFPRHAKGRPFEVSLFGGPYFDWRTLELDSALDRLASAITTKGSSKSVTDEGRELGRWSLKRGHGFQIADVVEAHASDRIRGNGTQGFDIECPFDENHSNAGDHEDRACFCVNAGEGASEFFTISCRHESCRDKTMLDMLGKMLKDGWFGRDVLEDEQFNAILEEDQKTEVAKKIEKQDEAKEAYVEAIDRLAPNTKDDELEEIIGIVIDADLGAMEFGRMEVRIKEKLQTTIETVRKAFKAVHGRRNKDAATSGSTRTKDGKLIFPFNGEYNFDEAFDVCIRSLADANRKAGEPLYCCIDSEPVRMMTKADEGKKSISFDAVSNQTLWSELNGLVTFVRRSDQGDGSRGKVPEDVGKQVYEQAYRRLPQAPEVIYTPLFLASGDLVVTPGYHYMADNPEFLNLLLVDNGLDLKKLGGQVPVDPTFDEVEEAVSWLRTELFADFPFLDYDTEGNERREPSEANALAMILTPFMRRMIHGRTPVFFVYKPQPGTGGTLLGQLPMWLFDGQAGSATRYSQNEEEMQKGLIAAVQDRRSHLFFDDVSDFNNRELLRAITQANVSGRLLGSSKNISVPNKFNWIGTGNNTVILDEMRRRTVFIRLNARMPDVQKRVFRHPDISGMGYEQFVVTHRALAIRYILTMIQYWINTGMEPFTLRRRASFEDWSAKVGGVLQACGVEGFLDNFNVITTDLNEAANRQFVREFFKKFGTNNVQKANDLFEFAVGIQLDILSGNTDDQKRSRFIKNTLIGLDGRTYAIDGGNFMFQQTMDDDQNVGFHLVKVIHATIESQDQKAA